MSVILDFQAYLMTYRQCSDLALNSF